MPLEQSKKGMDFNMKKFAREFLKLFWIFVFGCIMGYVMEVIFNFVRTGEFETRQGLIYGPFAPVYGIGTLAFYLILPKFKKMWQVFLVSGVLGGVTEYLSSYFQEKLFGTISWDYSNQFLNFNGRTSILYCIVWGALGFAFIKFVYACFDKIFDKVLYKIGTKVITAFAVVFMIFNISISSLAAQREYERREHIEAGSRMDVFLDEHFPDEILDEVYRNRIEK